MRGTLRPVTSRSPFGDRGGRLHRTLVYFGLRDDPHAPAPAPAETAAPAAEADEAEPSSRWHRARVYFGLADDGGRSRFGPGVTGRLDAELDELRRRVDALERERGRRR